MKQLSFMFKNIVAMQYLVKKSILLVKILIYKKEDSYPRLREKMQFS